jgi:hypothetical protein
VLIASGRRWDASSLQLALAAQSLIARDVPVSIAVPMGTEAWWQAVVPDAPVSVFDAEGSTRAIRASLRSVADATRANVALVDDDVLRRILARLILESGCVLQRVPFGAARPEESMASRLWFRRVPQGLLVPSLGEIDTPRAITQRVPAFEVPLVAAVPEVGVRTSTRETPVLLVVPDAESPLNALPALRAAAQVARRHDDLRVHLLGVPSEIQELRVYAAALHLSAQLTTGPLTVGVPDVPAGTVAAWITAEGDAGVCAALSVMAQRIPVLVPSTSSLAPAIADRVTGVLLDASDSLADAVGAGALARMIAHEDEQRSMGAAARARVQRLHGASRLGDAVLDAAERVLATARRAA